jgi:hypothetical protein
MIMEANQLSSSRNSSRNFVMKSKKNPNFFATKTHQNSECLQIPPLKLETILSDENDDGKGGWINISL